MPSSCLILNAGSSSLKFAVFELGPELQRTASGVIERIGRPDAVLKLKSGPAAQTPPTPVDAPTHASCLELILDQTGRGTTAEFAAVGHRVVHGGPHYFTPQRVTPKLVEALHGLSPFDPEHLPAELELIAAVQHRFPEIPQVACFDTAFHHRLPRVAQLLPIPRRFETAGVRRYGFHGLSYEFLLGELARLGGHAATRGRVILAHLGSGASLTAVRDGQSIDTTMGFTPTAGLVMGTRTGDLDPGLVAYLASTEKMSAAQFSRLVNHESGLLGVSGTSADMRELLAHEATDFRAAEAIALFCYQAKKYLGAYVAALGGLDTLVFSGGIGENCPAIRARICEGLGIFGIELNKARNAAGAPLISAEAGRVTVRVIHTDEELVIARAVTHLLKTAPALAQAKS